MGKSSGRPSKFDGIDQTQVEFLAKKGFTDKEFCAFFKVDEKSWNNWKNKYATFFQSLNDWKAQADKEVEKSLYQRACGFACPEEKIVVVNGQIERVQTTRHYPPDATSMIFWLKNRNKEEWRDQKEVGGDPNRPIQITTNIPLKFDEE